ncbi:MAG: sigma-70 family RNA polymerase sigma factor [Acidimicrobiales bacterium]|nr:sigma-70 family RNA polymerase sigma factor [Acidimicrobiales bacterium]
MSTTSSTTSTDIELVELAQDGHRAAFDELIRRHDERMRSLAFRLLADRHVMDDVLQDAYLKAFRGLDRFRPGSDFSPWLYRVTYNACIDELRRRKRTPASTHEDAEIASMKPGPAQLVGTSEAVRLALADLSAGQRITVVLVDGEGFDHQEAADILGVAPGTVASRLYRARTKLRRLLWDEMRR